MNSQRSANRLSAYQARGVALAWATLIGGLLSTSATGYLQLAFVALAVLCQLASIVCLLVSKPR